MADETYCCACDEPIDPDRDPHWTFPEDNDVMCDACHLATRPGGTRVDACCPICATEPCDCAPSDCPEYVPDAPVALGDPEALQGECPVCGEVDCGDDALPPNA
jgi:hypothetical protein